MGQCKRICANGEQCSNRAVPGIDYCEEHRRQRIQFHPVPPVPAPPPEKKRARKEAQKPPPPNWVARPSAAGDTPAFPGLRADARNILVAPQACTWLGARGVKDQPAPLFERLVRLLSALSHETPLPAHVTMRAAPEGAGVFVSVVPPYPDAVDLSHFYDTAAAAAALGGGLLYVGSEDTRAFIQYRDGAAPRGYDVEREEEKAPPVPVDEWYLVDREGTHPVSLRALGEVPLDELLLRIAPLPARGVELPEVVFALVAPSLYRMLARYLREHHLRYRIARFHPSTPPETGSSPLPGGTEGGSQDTLMLFEIVPRPDAPTGALLPAFVLSYLDDMPRCTVLVETWADVGRRMLVEWRSRYPCLPRHVVGAFPSDSLLLFSAGLDFGNLCVSPAPAFFEGDELMAAHAPKLGRVDLTPRSDRNKLPLELDVRLVPDSGPTPATAALVLDVKEIEWVRRLLYRLPGEAFEGYTLCLGQDHAVLVGEGMPVESLPFGVPLRRVQGAQLFIPLHARFAPDLPWSLLAESLELDDGAYTFLTPEFRLDVPRAGFAPISRALVANPGRPRVAFEVRPAPDLPQLRWTAPPRPKPEVVEPQPVQEEQRGWFRRVIEGGVQPRPTPSDTKPVSTQTVEPEDPGSWLRDRAESYRQAGDHLSAALCFALANDPAEAGHCYRVGARGTVREKEIA